MGSLSASEAFWTHLRTLCLDQFPCGTGSWNKSRFPPRKAKAPGRFRQQRMSSLMSDQLIPPTEETVEALTAFLRSPGSPWALPSECIPEEDQHLRELAVQTPQVIQDSFIFSYFTSLRIVNKGVNEIDANLLKFPNLEELILSANHISRINSANLPPTLKVLELCGNEVDCLKDLCASPPPELQHLGLGHNCRLSSSQEEYLTDAFWPKLVSLDLSYNNFTDLLGLLAKLRTLKKLRVLVLQGNPLALMPGYRAFTIDSLPKLCALDDNNINPDERHMFLGTSDNPALLQEDVEIVVTIGKIRGVPNPVYAEEQENCPETPVVTYSYYVTYEFAKGEKISDGDSTKVMASQNPVLTVLDVESPLADPEEAGGNGTIVLDVPIKQDPPSEMANVYSTLRKPWAETIECEYRKKHITKDLVALKAYLLAGTTVAVVEEKIVSWPVTITPLETPSKKGKGKAEKGKPEKGKKEKAKEEKDKAEKGKQKDGGKGSDKKKKKKKKKTSSPELQSDPPILKTLGAGPVSLQSLLAGESPLTTVCDFGILITEPSPQPSTLKEKNGKKDKNKDKKRKSGAESTAVQKNTSPVKGKGRKQESPKGADIQTIQPVPLTVEFQIQHQKWKSASQTVIKHKMSM